MTLAAILGICLLCPAWTAPTAYARSDQTNGQPSSTQTQSAPTATGQTQNPARPSKPAPKKTRRHHKAATPNCLDPAVTAKTPADSPALQPCPPKKTVVRNGGTDESSVQLTGSDPAKQASQGTAAQLLEATQENLNKLAGRQLNADQQQILSQIHEFMEQSKQADAAGDLERGQNLASKARLLSDELVKP
jgi:hypothetical protein